MPFSYSKEHLKGKELVFQRLFEILPGLTSWTILLGMTILSLFQPIVAAIIIIAFYFYWLLRLVYMTIFLGLSYYRLKVEQNTDWMKRVKALDGLEQYAQIFTAKAKHVSFKDRLSFLIHKKETLA